MAESWSTAGLAESRPDLDDGLLIADDGQWMFAGPPLPTAAWDISGTTTRENSTVGALLGSSQAGWLTLPASRVAAEALGIRQSAIFAADLDQYVDIIQLARALDEDDAVIGGPWERLSARLPLEVTAEPLVVAVRARNAGGFGPATVASRAAVASCPAFQYLSTQVFDASNPESASSVVCLDCPKGADCAGLAAGNVTAQSGFWRLPWASSSSLVFAPCPIPGNCVGSRGLSGDGSSSSSSTAADSGASAAGLESSISGDNAGTGAGDSRRLIAGPRSPDPQRRVQATLNSTRSPSLPPISYYTSGDEAAGGLTLSPGSLERCVEGHAGVLCTGCVHGWTRDGVFACEECPSPGWWTLALIVATLGAVVVWVYSGWSVDRVVLGVRPSQYMARARRGLRPKGIWFWLSCCDLFHEMQESESEEEEAWQDAQTSSESTASRRS